MSERRSGYYEGPGSKSEVASETTAAKLSRASTDAAHLGLSRVPLRPA
jgi:hypothetical protein